MTSDTLESDALSPRIVRIVCEFWFEASHRLERSDWSAEKNDAIFGKCVRLHGHSYHLRLWLRGPIDPETGMVINFRDVKVIVEERVIGRLDHRHLNDVLDEMTTAENLVYWIGEQVAPWISGAEVSRIELWETRTSGAVLEGEELARLFA